MEERDDEVSPWKKIKTTEKPKGKEEAKNVIN